MSRIGIIVAAVVICSLIAAASAIAMNQPVNEETKPVAIPTNTQTPDSTPTPTATPSPSPPEATPTTTTQPTPTETPPIASSSPVMHQIGTPAPTEAKTSVSYLFDPTFDSIFVSGTNRTVQYHDHFGFGITGNYTYYPTDIVLNLTYRGNPENEPYDTKIEGYLINFTADTGATTSFRGFFGTNLNASFEPAQNNAISMQLPQILSAIGVSGFTLHLNMTANESCLYKQFSNTESDNGGVGLWRNGAPSTITVTLYRTGCIVIDGETVWFAENPAKGIAIQQVQLQTSADGFVY